MVQFICDRWHYSLTTNKSTYLRQITIGIRHNGLSGVH